MAIYIVFLRAVNVAGRTVKMADLRSHLSAAGFTDVETHIQSGNVRLGSRARSGAAVERAVEAALSSLVDFEVATIVRTPGELTALVAESPPSPLGPEARHYVALMRAEPAEAASASLAAWDVPGERITPVGRDLHLWFTKPSHEAKASNARLEKLSGTIATSRDWRVITALAEKWG